MDIYSTNSLIDIVENLKRPQMGLLDLFFPMEARETTEEIHIDIDLGKRRVAPFVSPVVSGKVVARDGYRTDTFKPAYVKPKSVLEPRKALRRMIGEQIGGGPMSPMDRQLALLAMELEDHVGRIDRRMELMAAEALRLGQVTVSGDQYPTVVVSFSRAGGHTITLADPNQWNDSGIKPLDDLDTWAMLSLADQGVFPESVVMTTDVWKVFRANADVKDRLDLRRVMQANMDVGAQNREGLVFRGDIDNFAIYTYAGWYIDDAGASQPILPAGTVLMGSAEQSHGIRAFGAIQDEQAGLNAMPYFPKSWLEQDPGARMVMTQSAPLTVLGRPNSTIAATVL